MKAGQRGDLQAARFAGGDFHGGEAELAAVKIAYASLHKQPNKTRTTHHSCYNRSAYLNIYRMRCMGNVRTSQKSTQTLLLLCP